MQANQHTDIELASLISQGDETAFSMFFHRHHRKIYQVGVMLTGSESMAEELVQEVFLKVWLRRDTLPEIGNPESWLFVVARNDAYKALKRSLRVQSLLEGMLDDSLPTNETEELVQFRNVRELLQQAVDRLPPRQQTAWRLTKEAGLNRNEVAEHMQIRPDTVKEHMALAIKSIRAYLQASGSPVNVNILLFCTMGGL